MAMTLGGAVERAMARALGAMEDELRMGMASAPDELKRAADDVLSGTHSMPGMPPAMRTGGYRDSWRAQGVEEERISDALVLRARLSTTMPERAMALEHGTGGISPRPHFGRILDRATAAVRERL